MLCGNVSSFRLFFAQQLTDILVYIVCGYNARYLAAVQCSAIGPVCGFVCVGLFVCLWVCLFVGLLPR